MEANYSATLPDETLMLRGGKNLNHEKLSKRARVCLAEHGRHGISVIGFPDMEDPAEIVVRARAESGGRWLRHDWVRSSSAGKLLENGFTLERTDEDGHYLLMLPNPFTDAHFDALIEAFKGDPVRTPKLND